MTQEFEGAALDFIQPAYGQSGIDAAQQTFLADGDISQILDVKDSARRGRTPFQRGIFTAVLENVHAVAGELQSFVDPYNPVNVHNGFPASINPNLFDIWLLGASSVSNLDIDWSILMEDMNTLLVGMSDTAAGGPAGIATRSVLLAAFDDFATIALSTGPELGLATGTGRGMLFDRFRCSPGNVLIHRSKVAAASTVRIFLKMGIFPVTLGQDLW